MLRRKEGKPTQLRAWMVVLVLVSAPAVAWGHWSIVSQLTATEPGRGPEDLLLARAPPGEPPSGAVSPDGGQIWVTNYASGDISVFETKTRRLIRRLPVVQGPHHVAFSKDGAFAYVVSEVEDEVVEVEVASGQVQARIPVGRGPHGVAVR